MGSAAPAPPALTIHVPIEIFGESNFTAANGVSAGTGSPEDPFVVENLEIDRGGSYIGLVVYNTTSHLIIRNISILNGTFGYGIYLASASNVTVEDASVSGGVWAIMTEDSRDISISRLTATLGFGVDFTSSDRVALRDSRLLGNQTLVYVESTTHATLKNVSIERGALSFAGTEIEHYRSHSINSDVTVSGMPIQYVTDCTGAQAPAPGVVEFLMFGCEDVVIKDTIFEAPQGFMHFAFVRGLTLTGNTFRNGFGGFSASYATDVRVDANTFEASASGGIHVSNSERVEISANALRLTSSFGVMLSNVSDFAVSGNALRGGLETAVSVAHSRHGSIGANVIDNTSNAGIELAASSQILASSNTVTNAKAFGLRLSSVSDSRVEANTIVRAGGVGLSISGSQAVAIVGNDLADGDVGIDLDGVTGGALLDNRIVGHAAAGLRLGAVQDLTIDRNTLEGNAHGVEIGEGYGFDPGTLGIGPANFVDGRPIVYRSGCEGNTVEPVSPYLAIIANCTNVLITNGTFDGAHSRLWLYGVEGGQVTGLRFNGSHGTPLRVENSQNVSVADNSFSNLTAAAAVLVDSQNLSFQRNQVETAEGQGVDLEDCAKCTVSQNRLVASNASAIRVFGSDDVAVEGNEINDSLRGVSVFYSDRVRIQDNTIARSLDAGISTSSTTDLSILGNRIESSRVAGMSLSSGRYTNVSGNRITGSPDGLAIERTRSVYVWLNDFSSNSNHALRVTESSRIFVFSNNFDRASGSIAQDADRTNFHRGWITGGNFWAGHAIHDQCSGPFQSTACGSPDGFEDDSFLIDGVWRAWYSLGEPAVDADHDMMADSWEERFGLDPSDPADAGADPDADSLSNLQEFLIGASPRAADTDEDLVGDASDDLVWWPNEEYRGRQSVKFIGIVAAGMFAATIGLVLGLNRVARKAQR